ncbi:MAG: hypothetical protein AB7D92_03970 [Sphaerochaeta sp.]
MHHIQDMKAFFSILTVFLLICVVLPGQGFPGQHEPQLPIDANIGQIVTGEEGSAEAVTKEALGTPYDPPWVDQYVTEALRKAFVSTYGDLLGSLLPAKQIQTGRAKVRGNLYEVPFCLHEPVYRWGTMVWTREAEMGWYLVAVAIETPESLD